MKNYVFLGYFNKLTLTKLMFLLPAPFLAILDTVKNPLIALLLVIIIDLLTALTSHFTKISKENNKLSFSDIRSGIKSGGLRKTVKKSYEYGVAFIVSFIIEVYGFKDNILSDLPYVEVDAGITETIIWTFVLIEVWSIDENLREVTGSSLITKVKNIIKKIKSFK